MTELVQRPEPRATPHETKQPKVGDWFNVTLKEHTRDGQKAVTRLRCITHLGSNYAEMTSAGGSKVRIHFDEFAEHCEAEPDAERAIAEHVDYWRGEARRLMGEVRALTAKLAITPVGELPAQSETASLVLQSSRQPVEEYKAALVKAKEEDLPELFEKLRDANESMATWMKAALIPLEAEASSLKGSIKAIESRVFNVELYAGLVEQVVEVAEGEPAPANERVRLHQRRCYMDEECLARYEVGGMAFEDIADFDEWMARKENRDRLLPHPRCAVAFRVRRNTKERGWYESFIRLFNGDPDKYTYLYIRNGERLYRLSTGIDFGEKLFPDIGRDALTSGQKLWAKGVRHGKSWIKDLITDDERQGIIEAKEKAQAAVKAFKPPKPIKEMTKEEKAEFDHQKWLLSNEVSSCDSDLRDLEPYVPDSVYYDDVASYVSDRLMEHNRLMLIVQGLFDRSPVFHPHPTHKLWERGGFEQAIELVFDDSRALTSGDKPDFEAYRAKLNESLQPGCVTVGQQRAWMEHEAEKENERRANDWRWRRDNRYSEDLKLYKPYGNPGPGRLACPTKVTRGSHKCTYEWHRQRMRQKWGAEDRLKCTFTAESSQVLNVSAYRPGDFKVFFDDPRTRADYLQWAPLLLEAEEYHAGNRKVGKGDDD